MAYGPGRYDHIAQRVLEETGAEKGVILVVFHDAKNVGVSAKLRSPDGTESPAAARKALEFAYEELRIVLRDMRRDLDLS